MAATIAKPMARPVLVLSSDLFSLALGKVAFAEEKKIICVRGAQLNVVYYDKDYGGKSTPASAEKKKGR